MNLAQQMKAIALLALIACAGLSGQARAETINCTEIATLPATISAQGVYCLKKHISTNLASGSAITVTTNNVTIDCNEFKIGNLAAGLQTQATGISASGRINVTVRNCGIRGFQTGVDFTNGQYRVETSRVDNNTQVGIRVGGDGSVIRRNEVVDTGTSQVAGVTQFYGIFSEGNVDIADNIVSGVVATSEGSTSRHVYGIYGTDMNAGLVQGNRVLDLAPYGSLGNRHGIRIEDGSNNAVRGNTVVMGSGLLATDTAIRCGSSVLGLIGGAANDNVVLQAGLLGTAGALLNCTSVLGGNYVNL